MMFQLSNTYLFRLTVSNAVNQYIGNDIENWSVYLNSKLLIFSSQSDACISQIIGAGVLELIVDCGAWAWEDVPARGCKGARWRTVLVLY